MASTLNYLTFQCISRRSTMTRAPPCHALCGSVGYRPMTSVCGHGSPRKQCRSGPPGSPVTTGGAPQSVQHTPHEARAPTAASWRRAVCHRTELVRIDAPARLSTNSAAGRAGFHHGEHSSAPKQHGEPRRVPDLGQCRVRVGPRELGPTGPQLHPHPAPRRPPEPGRPVASPR